MPRLPRESEKALLHSIIKALVITFSRNAIFTFSDIRSGGSGAGGRVYCPADQYLPEPVALEHLKELEQRGWIKLSLQKDPWTFEITPSFQDLPDLITPDDIMSEKIDFISRELSEKYPIRYKLLNEAQKKLLLAATEEDFAGVGILCVQFWEDFTDELWLKYMANEEKPAKDRTKDKMGPIAEKFIESKTTSAVCFALGELFKAVSALTQKAKHRGVRDKPVTLRDAKLMLLLTVVLADEIVNKLSQ